MPFNSGFIEISFKIFSTDCVIQCNLIIRLYHIVGIQKLGTCSDNINVHLYAFYFFPLYSISLFFLIFQTFLCFNFFLQNFFSMGQIDSKNLALHCVKFERGLTARSRGAQRGTFESFHFLLKF